MTPVTSSQTDQVLAEIQHGRKIEAIKLLRQFTGLELAAAKAVVDEWPGRKSSTVIRCGAGNGAATLRSNNIVPRPGTQGRTMHRQTSSSRLCAFESSCQNSIRLAPAQ